MYLEMVLWRLQTRPNEQLRLYGWRELRAYFLGGSTATPGLWTVTALSLRSGAADLSTARVDRSAADSAEYGLEQSNPVQVDLDRIGSQGC